MMATATATMANQKMGVCLLSTMPPMRSVTVVSVWPGPITGGLTPFGGNTSISSSILGAIRYAFFNSGLGLRTSAMYVVRGRVFNSANNA